MSAPHPIAIDPFEHDALFYSDLDTYLAGTVPFVHAGIARSEPVLVAVPPRNLDALRDHVHHSGERVQFADMTQGGRNPGRIIPWVLRSFIEAHPGERVRVLGEPIWAERSEVEYPACVQHEALINTAFTGHQISILCPYDVAALAPDALDTARHTHPVLIEDGQRHASDAYTEPETVVARFNTPLPPAPADVPTLIFATGELAVVRRHVSQQASHAGLHADRLAELLLAANEVATNTIVHAAGAGTLRVWTDDGHVVCEISDRGVITDPMVGRAPSKAAYGMGRGLMLVNYLCDLVRMHTRPDGTTVRMYMRLPAHSPQ